MRRRLRVLSLLFACVTPAPAWAGMEIVPFGGYTRLDRGDAACDGEISSAMGGVGLGASVLGSLDLGLKVAHFGGKGSCGGTTSIDSLSLYLNLVLHEGTNAKGLRTFAGIGAEGGVTSGTVKIPGRQLDFAGGEMWAVEAFYKWPLRSSGSVRHEGQDYPMMVIYLTPRVGYRGGTVTYTDTQSFTEDSVAVGGPYVALALTVYLNPFQ